MFKPGQPKPTGSGIKKGQKHKKKTIRIDDYIAENNINLAELWLQTIQQISDPAQKAKCIQEYYRYIDAPIRERIIDQESSVEGNEESASIVSIVSGNDE